MIFLRFQKFSKPLVQWFSVSWIINLFNSQLRLDKIQWINKVADSLRVFIFGILYRWEEFSY